MQHETACRQEAGWTSLGCQRPGLGCWYLRTGRQRELYLAEEARYWHPNQWMEGRLDDQKHHCWTSLPRRRLVLQQRHLRLDRQQLQGSLAREVLKPSISLTTLVVTCRGRLMFMGYGRWRVTDASGWSSFGHEMIVAVVRRELWIALCQASFTIAGREAWKNWRRSVVSERSNREVGTVTDFVKS